MYGVLKGSDTHRRMLIATKLFEEDAAMVFVLGLLYWLNFEKVREEISDVLLHSGPEGQVAVRTAFGRAIGEAFESNNARFAGVMCERCDEYTLLGNHVCPGPGVLH